MSIIWLPICDHALRSSPPDIGGIWWFFCTSKFHKVNRPSWILIRELHEDDNVSPSPPPQIRLKPHPRPSPQHSSYSPPRPRTRFSVARIPRKFELDFNKIINLDRKISTISHGFTVQTSSPQTILRPRHNGCIKSSSGRLIKAAWLDALDRWIPGSVSTGRPFQGSWLDDLDAAAKWS